MSDLRLLNSNQGSNAHLFFQAKTVSSSIMTMHYTPLPSEIITNNANQNNMDVVGLVNFHIIHSKYELNF